MALTQSDLSELLDALRAGGDLDVIRTSVEMVLQALIDAEATEFIGAEPHERTPDAHEPTQRQPASVVVDEGRRCRAGDPEAAPGVVLPVGARAAPPDRPGVVRGGDGGLRARRVDPQGRRPRRGARPRVGDLQVRGESRSAPSSTRRSKPSERGPWSTSSSRTCSSTPPTSRPASAAGSSPGRWWSRRGSPAPATGKSSASTSATPKTARSGPRFLRSLRARASPVCSS